MDYKTILVHLDRGARSAERLELGFGVAEAFGAHLVGLFALSAVWIPSAAIAGQGDAPVEREARRRAEQAAEAEKRFRAAAARHGGVASEYRASAGDAVGAVRLSARYADLVITGQRNRAEADETGLVPGFVEELLLSAGRPVLVVPFAGSFSRMGRRVLVAWNGSREAARAVTDALPLLKRAEAVEVVAFDPQAADHGEQPGADIALWLARHGVKVTAAQQRGADIDVGMQLLSRASDRDADLIVMGAYGHSRVRELVLGGATRALLESMTVPVLMSH